MFQEAMNCVLGDLPCAQVHLNDILCAAAGTCEDHLEKLRAILNRLNKNGFEVNARKSAFVTGGLEHLGHCATRDGIQQQPEKVEVALRLTPPKTALQPRCFSGMVSFHRGVWRCRSHVLSPLTSFASERKKFTWGPE
jgi:hypothetical protein